MEIRTRAGRSTPLPLAGAREATIETVAIGGGAVAIVRVQGDAEWAALLGSGGDVLWSARTDLHGAETGTGERAEQRLIDEGTADRADCLADGGAGDRRSEEREPAGQHCPADRRSSDAEDKGRH